MQHHVFKLGITVCVLLRVFTYILAIKVRSGLGGTWKRRVDHWLVWHVAKLDHTTTFMGNNANRSAGAWTHHKILHAKRHWQHYPRVSQRISLEGWSRMVDIESGRMKIFNERAYGDATTTTMIGCHWILVPLDASMEDEGIELLQAGCMAAIRGTWLIGGDYDNDPQGNSGISSISWRFWTCFIRHYGKTAIHLTLTCLWDGGSYFRFHLSHATWHIFNTGFYYKSWIFIIMALIG